MSDPIRIVVADDHPMFRAGVVASLAAQPDVEVVAEGSSAAEALRLVELHSPDICLLDIAMPGGGLTAARDITAASPADARRDADSVGGRGRSARGNEGGRVGLRAEGRRRVRAVDVLRKRPCRRGVRRAGACLGPVARDEPAEVGADSTSCQRASARCWSWSRPGFEQPGDRRPAAASPRRRSSTT